MRNYIYPALFASCLFAPQSAWAQAGSWQVVDQTGGYKVARVAMAGRATGIGLTCEQGIAVIAVNLAQPPRRNPAALTLRGATGSKSFGILRNGMTSVWVASIKDPAILDMLASEQSVALAVDGANYGTAPLSGAAAAMRTALADCWRQGRATMPSSSAATTKVATGTDPDEAAVRAAVGSIYGWRDGRQIKMIDDYSSLFGSRVRALVAECELVRANADPSANGGEGAYSVTGDQGCDGTPFLMDAVLGDPAPFIPQVRPKLRRVGTDTIEVETVVPPAYRKNWGESETIRFQRSGGRWLIDEVVSQGSTGTSLYSGQIAEMIAELRQIAKKPSGQRNR